MSINEDFKAKQSEGLSRLAKSLRLDPAEKVPPEDVDFKEPSPGIVTLNTCDYVVNGEKCEFEREIGTRFCENHQGRVITRKPVVQPMVCDDDESESDDDISQDDKYKVDGREGLFQLQATMYGTIDMFIEHQGLRSDLSMYDRFNERKEEFMKHYQNLIDVYGYDGLMKYITNPMLAWALASSSIGMEKYLNIQRIRKHDEL